MIISSNTTCQNVFLSFKQASLTQQRERRCEIFFFSELEIRYFGLELQFCISYEQMCVLTCIHHITYLFVLLPELLKGTWKILLICMRQSVLRRTQMIPPYSFRMLVHPGYFWEPLKNGMHSLRFENYFWFFKFNACIMQKYVIT